MTTYYYFRAHVGPVHVEQQAQRLREHGAVEGVFAGTEHVHFRIATPGRSYEQGALYLADAVCSELRFGRLQFLRADHQEGE